MQTVAAFNAREYVKTYVNTRTVPQLEQTELAINFAFGKQVRVSKKEAEHIKTTRTEEGIYGVNVVAGYANLTAAFIGWVREQGWASVLDWWGVKVERATGYAHVPTTVVVTKHVTREVTEHYYNVVPLPKNFNQQQIRYAVAHMSGNQRYDFIEATEDFNDMTWLASIPPTKEEVRKAITLPYEDVNFAALMQRWSN